MRNLRYIWVVEVFSEWDYAWVATEYCYVTREKARLEVKGSYNSKTNTRIVKYVPEVK